MKKFIGFLVSLKESVFKNVWSRIRPIVIFLAVFFACLFASFIVGKLVWNLLGVIAWNWFYIASGLIWLGIGALIVKRHM